MFGFAMERNQVVPQKRISVIDAERTRSTKSAGRGGTERNYHLPVEKKKSSHPTRPPPSNPTSFPSTLLSHPHRRRHALTLAGAATADAHATVDGSARQHRGQTRTPDACGGWWSQGRRSRDGGEVAGPEDGAGTEGRSQGGRSRRCRAGVSRLSQGGEEPGRRGGRRSRRCRAGGAVGRRAGGAVGAGPVKGQRLRPSTEVRHRLDR